jgi:F0F1-type ATP synthase membrane subunit a
MPAHFGLLLDNLIQLNIVTFYRRIVNITNGVTCNYSVNIKRVQFLIHTTISFVKQLFQVRSIVKRKNSFNSFLICMVFIVITNLIGILFIISIINKAIRLSELTLKTSCFLLCGKCFIKDLNIKFI